MNDNYDNNNPAQNFSEGEAEFKAHMDSLAAAQAISVKSSVMTPEKFKAIVQVLKLDENSGSGGGGGGVGGGGAVGGASPWRQEAEPGGHTSAEEGQLRYLIRSRGFRLVSFPEVGGGATDQEEHVLAVPARPRARSRGRATQSPEDGARPRLLMVIHTGQLYDVVRHTHEVLFQHGGYKRVLDHLQNLYYGVTRGYVQEFCSMCPTCRPHRRRGGGHQDDSRRAWYAVPQTVDADLEGRTSQRQERFMCDGGPWARNVREEEDGDCWILPLEVQDSEIFPLDTVEGETAGAHHRRVQDSEIFPLDTGAHHRRVRDSELLPLDTVEPNTTRAHHRRVQGSAGTTTVVRGDTVYYVTLDHKAAEADKQGMNDGAAAAEDSNAEGSSIDTPALTPVVKEEPVMIDDDDGDDDYSSGAIPDDPTAFHVQRSTPTDSVVVQKTARNSELHRHRHDDAPSSYVTQTSVPDQPETTTTTTTTTTAAAVFVRTLSNTSHSIPLPRHDIASRPYLFEHVSVKPERMEDEEKEEEEEKEDFTKHQASSEPHDDFFFSHHGRGKDGSGIVKREGHHRVGLAGDDNATVNNKKKKKKKEKKKRETPTPNNNNNNHNNDDNNRTGDEGAGSSSEDTREEEEEEQHVVNIKSEPGCVGGSSSEDDSAERSFWTSEKNEAVLCWPDLAGTGAGAGAFPTAAERSSRRVCHPSPSPSPSSPPPQPPPPPPPPRPAPKRIKKEQPLSSETGGHSPPPPRFRFLAHVSDPASKLHVLFPLRGASASEVASGLERHVLTYYGTPRFLHSSRGFGFVEDVLLALSGQTVEGGGCWTCANGRGAS
ncbi:uncharacterized protein LOC143275489 [Babylonia areolata]|uniref:uncharacterized protein LOC143275489 n=1 Tax=Babylonia areolata TaxID=304850 RepID=UPI003FCFCF8F